MKIILFAKRNLLGKKTWRFRITQKGIGSRDIIVAQSQGYSRRIDAKGTALSMKRHLAAAEIVELEE